jgi:Ca2+-binding RTX toxin-like protein
MARSGRFERVTAAWAVALCGVALAAAPAPAATLEDGVYRAGPGEANSLRVAVSEGYIEFHDPGAEIATEGDTCSLADPSGHRARCAASVRPWVELGDGDDSLDLDLPETGSYGIPVWGGAGADQLNVRTLDASIRGDDGDDRIDYFALGHQRYDQFGTLVEERRTGAQVDAGDGNDLVTLTGLENRVYGGAGNDVLLGDDRHPQQTDGACTRLGINGCEFDPVTECARSWVTNDLIDGGPGDDLIVGRDGHDKLNGQDGRDTIDGGAACDQVTGDFPRHPLHQPGVYADESKGGEADVLDGGPQNDWVVGGVGDDRVSGGDGNDQLNGGSGADVHAGGAQSDSINYGDRAGPVNADLDGIADDGEAGEGDLLGTDMENVIGTQGADTLTGNAAANELLGLGGDDVLVGGGGAHDFLKGQGGNDFIYAREGEKGVEFSPVAGLSWLFDDRVYCDGEKITPIPADLPQPEVLDPGGSGDNDVAVVDPADGMSTYPVPFPGCEVVLYNDRPVTVDPDATQSVPVPGYCDPGAPGSACSATASVIAPVGGVSAARFKPAAAWRRLGSRTYSGRRGAKPKRVRVPISPRAARRARGGKRVKAYVAFRYRKR